MKTEAILVVSHCVPCFNRCRYCLLSWDGKTVGAEYARSAAYAKRFHDWIQANRPELNFNFSFGYSMEHPRLLEAVDFLNSIGSVGGQFLQFDGMKMRTKAELRTLLSGLKDHGIRMIDLTFYGTEAYHDRFAARKWDYRLMMDTLAAAAEIGLAVTVDIPLTHENTPQIDDLMDTLQGYPLRKLILFVPHSEGRGANLDSVRFAEEDEKMLNERAKAHFNRSLYRPERQWLEMQDFPVPERRMLQLSLTRDNIQFFEEMSFADAISYLESLDDAYYAAIPDMKTLAGLYGDPENTAFYRERDLRMHYIRRYLRDHTIRVSDMNDERYCSSRRY